MLEPSLALRRDIAREIRRHKPDVLICPSPGRQLNGYGGLDHPDHFAAGEATMAAVFPTSRDRLTFPKLLEEGLEPHKVREVWVMWPEDADIYVDVTDYVDLAVKALAQHKTQVGDDDVDADIKHERRHIGEKVGFRYAESYKRFRLG
jgi:LmbE family N-acetylglucosaminyl deacetylase